MFLVYTALFQQSNFFEFLSGICQWDCYWYQGLTKEGYHFLSDINSRGEANWAFFPLYPFLAAQFNSILGLGALASGILVSNIASFLIPFAAVPYFKGHLQAYSFFCVLVFFGPFSFYFASYYTEALFFLFSLIGLSLIHKRWYISAGIAIALLSATRSVGVFMTLSLLSVAIYDHFQANGRCRNLPLNLASQPRLILGIAIAPLGLFAFMLFLHFHMGDALAFSHVQRGWNREIGNPLSYLYNGLKWWDWTNLLEGEASRSWSVFWALGGLILTSILTIYRRLAEAVFTWFALLIPLSTGLMAMPRYVVGTAPLIILVAELLSKKTDVGVVFVGGLVGLNVWLLLWWYQGAAFLV